MLHSSNELTKELIEVVPLKLCHDRKTVLILSCLTNWSDLHWFKTNPYMVPKFFYFLKMDCVWALLDNKRVFIDLPVPLGLTLINDHINCREVLKIFFQPWIPACLACKGVLQLSLLFLKPLSIYDGNPSVRSALVEKHGLTSAKKK